MTYQLCDISHLSHVVQCVFCGFVQHDEAGGHNAQVPQGLRVRLHVTVSICQRVIGGFIHRRHIEVECGLDKNSTDVF